MAPKADKSCVLTIVILSVWIALFVPPTHAQEAPTPLTPDASEAASEPVERPQIGDATHQLLAAQAEGRNAGATLPMLGATATLSLQRYFDSYNTKIPTFFDTKVGTSSSSAGH